MRKRLQLKDANVAIIGAGLMGGSILKAVKKCKQRPRKTIAVDIEKSVLEKIKNLSLADMATDDVGKALEDADLVVISLYPEQAINFVKQNAIHMKAGCVVTDICGIKREVVKSIPNLLPAGVSYVGGHPMAGREHMGFDYSTEDLFVNCKYIIQEDNSEGRDLVIEFAKALGAGQIVEATALIHDEMIAYTSQLPHVLAVAYMLCAGDRNVEEFSAGSFRDVTRVAMINDEMWSELFCDNSDMLAKEVEKLQEGLKELQGYIEDCDIESLRGKMKNAAKMRENIRE